MLRGTGLKSPHLPRNHNAEIHKCTGKQLRAERSGRLVGNQHDQGEDEHRHEREARLTRFAAAMRLCCNLVPVDRESDEKQAKDDGRRGTGSHVEVDPRSRFAQDALRRAMPLWDSLLLRAYSTCSAVAKDAYRR